MGIPPEIRLLRNPMDFLDPVKMRRHTQMLFLGYGLIAIAIVATALILLYQSSGYGVNRKGEVIQNGIVFTASTPSGAELYIDGQDSGSQTNRRLVLVAGQYVFQYQKAGYYSWTHSLTVQGSSVNRLDYSFLFPKKLDSVNMASFAQAPLFVSQSPDNRWLFVMLGDGSRNAEIYDLKNLDKDPLIAALPTSVSGATSSDWKLVEWANDNRHLLVHRTLSGASDYVLLDRQDPTQSVDLNKTLSQNPTEIRLHDLKYDQYYLYDATAKTLQTASLGQPQPLAYLQHVVAYKPYGSDQMLYVTDDIKQSSTNDLPLAVMLADGNQRYAIRKVPAGNHYLLEMAGYSGDTYIVAGVDTENKVLVYKNPVDQISNPSIGEALPVTALQVKGPTFVSFSDSARFVMAENGQNFGVYDAQINQTYNYTQNDAFDAPAPHAVWMDSNRLAYTSGGKLFVFDADQTNRRKLVTTAAAYDAAFTPDYKRVVTLAPTATGAYQLQYTWLRTTPDR
jgi:hypothetical protein